jgi:hypothetical protein
VVEQLTPLFTRDLSEIYIEAQGEESSRVSTRSPHMDILGSSDTTASHIDTTAEMRQTMINQSKRKQSTLSENRACARVGERFSCLCLSNINEDSPAGDSTAERICIRRNRDP